jgi:hypothetical protein
MLGTRLLRRLAALTPSSDFLNLLFGVFTAATISVLVGVALDPDRPSPQVKWAGAVLGLASLAVGTLTIVVGRIRSDALDGLGATISARERRAEVTTRLQERAGLLVLLQVTGLVGAVVGSVLLALGSSTTVGCSPKSPDSTSCTEPTNQRPTPSITGSPSAKSTPTKHQPSHSDRRTH